MKHLGVEISVKNQPVLDPSFIPMGLFNEAFLKTAKKPVSVAVERENGQVATVHTFIHGTEEMAQADTYYIERIVKYENTIFRKKEVPEDTSFIFFIF